MSELKYPSTTTPLSLPSYFDEEDAAKLVQQQALLTQQKQRATEYTTTWAGKPWYERAGRGIGAWLPLEKLPVPTFQYGLTPAETEAFALRTSTDVDELMRKQRVTIESQQIINSINMMHAAGVMPKSEGEIEGLFSSISGKDWTDADRNWVLDYARSSLTFAEGAEGELPSGFSPEDILTPTKEAKSFLTQGEQNLIASTVAFSKDISEVVAALQEMYTPVTPTKEEAQQDLTEFVHQSVEQAGITYRDDLTTEENYALLQDYLNANKMSMVSQWDWLQQNDPVAYEKQLAQYRYTPYPVDENNRIILTDEEQDVITGSGYIQESFLKDSLDDVMVGGKLMELSGERTFGATLPSQLFYPDIPVAPENETFWQRIKRFFSPSGLLPGKAAALYSYLPEEQIVMVNKHNAEMRQKFAEKYNQYTENFEQWYASNPELAPKPEYEEGFTTLVTDTKGGILKDPGYLSYLFLRQGLPTMTGIALSTGITVATRNPVLGGIVASAWFAPMNIDNLQEDLLRNGATWEQATQLSVPIGVAISLVEGVGDLPYLKALNPAMSSIIRKELGDKLVTLTTRQLIKKGIKTAAFIELSETMEEVVQQVMQNAAVGVVNKSRGLFDNISDTVLQSLVMIAPFSLFGGGISVRYINSNIEIEQRARNEAKVQQMMKEDGVSEEQAYLTVLTQMGETQEGLEVLTDAVEKTKLQEEDIKTQQEEDKVSEIRAWTDTHKYFNNTVQTGDWSFISAEVNKRQSETMTAEKKKKYNDTQMAKLREYLEKQTPYSFYATNWVSKGVKGENGYFVTGITPEKAAEIGRKFKQDSVYVPFGQLNKDGTYHPGDLTQVGIDGLEADHTVVSFNGEEHSVFIPTDYNQKLKYSPVAEPLAREKIWKGVEKKFKLDVVFEDEGVGILDSDYDDRVEKIITIGTDTSAIEDIFKKDTDKQSIILMVEKHEEGHHLDPKLQALNKIGDIITREVNAWKYAVKEVTKLGVSQSDAIRLLRDFAPRTQYEGLLDALIKAKVVPEEVTVLPRPIAAVKFNELTGIATNLPSTEFDLITGLRKIRKPVVSPEPVVSPVGETITGGEIPATAYAEGETATGEVVVTGAETVAEVPYNTVNFADLSTGTPPLSPSPADSLTPPQPKSWWQKKMKTMGELIRDIQTLKYTFMNWDKMTGRVQDLTNNYYRLSYNTELVFSNSDAVSKKSLNLILKNPHLAAIITNEDALARIEREIRARNPTIVAETGETHPVLSADEMEFANTIEKILDARKLEIRYRRFVTSWDKHKGSVTGVLADIPDGNEADFIKAGQLVESGDTDGLLSFLDTCTWGVMKSGYTPEQVFYPSVMRQRKWTETIGFGALQRREEIAAPEMETNLWQRTVKYVTQQDLAFRLTPYMQEANRMLQQDMAKGKIGVKQMGELTNMLADYFDTMLQRRASRGAAAQFAMNIAGQSYTTIFETYPVLALRNVIQGLMFYWDRPHLLMSLKTPWVAAENMFFDSKSSEMEGIRRDALLKGESNAPAILRPLNRLAHRVGMFSRSETYSRKATFHAAYTKAIAANEEYLKSSKTKADFNKWLNKSDAWVFEAPQRATAYAYLMEDKTSLGVPGLTNISGAEASALYLADQTVDAVHYRYTRWYRGKFEHSDTGKILFGLSTYPKSYAEMMIRRTSKMFDSSLPWNLRRKALYEVMGIVIVGMMGAAGLGKVTGKKTKSYSPWDMFNWQFGGLTVGVLQDLSGTMYDLMQAVIGDKASQNQVLSRLAKDTTGLVREYIPFYQQGIYLLETALGKEYIDTAFIRQVISQIDKDYTPAELENIERGWYEKFQHALFGGRESVQTTTSVVEKGASDIADWEKKLGKLDDKGELYSLQSFATDVRKVERDLPSGIISEEFGFTDLALFYVDCEDYIQREYYDKYNDVDKTKWRRLAREQNPNLDAILYLWGNVDTLLTSEARNIVTMLYNYYDVPVGARWTK